MANKGQRPDLDPQASLQPEKSFTRDQSNRHASLAPLPEARGEVDPDGRTAAPQVALANRPKTSEGAQSKNRVRALQVRSNLPFRREIFGWERELLLPFVHRVLEELTTGEAIDGVEQGHGEAEDRD